MKNRDNLPSSVLKSRLPALDPVLTTIPTNLSRPPAPPNQAQAEAAAGCRGNCHFRPRKTPPQALELPTPAQRQPIGSGASWSEGKPQGLIAGLVLSSSPMTLFSQAGPARRPRPATTDPRTRHRLGRKQLDGAVPRPHAGDLAAGTFRQSPGQLAGRRLTGMRAGGDAAEWPVPRRANRTGEGDDDPTIILGGVAQALPGGPKEAPITMSASTPSPWPTAALGDGLPKQAIPVRRELLPDRPCGARNDVDPKRLALTGNSMGGYFAPRAAAYEKRITAVIANSLAPD